MSIVEVPHGYNPLTIKDDVEYMFHWAKLNDDDDPVEWVEHGWDYAASGVWRKLRNNYQFPIYKPIQVINSLSELDTSFSSIQENIPSDYSSSTPLTSPLCSVKKLNKNIILKHIDSKPINPDSSFYDHVFKNKN